MQTNLKIKEKQMTDKANAEQVQKSHDKNIKEMYDRLGLHYAVGKGSKHELHAEKCTSHRRAVRGTYFYFKCTPCVRFCPIQNQTKDLTDLV